MSTDERTNTRGKSGTRCTECGMTYAACTDLVHQRNRSCCSSCGRSDTHDTRPAPRTWEIPDEPIDVDTVHTHDAGTGEPIIWRKNPARQTRGPWSTDTGDERLFWHELVMQGPVVEGEPPTPEYRPGFHRLHGALAPAEPGTLVFIAPASIGPGMWDVHLPDGSGMTRSEASLYRAGASRVDNP